MIFFFSHRNNFLRIVLLICETKDINYMTKLKFTKESFIGILIAIISLINLSNNLSDILHLSNIISIIGLVGVYFLFTDNKHYKKLIYIWIVSQIIIINRLVLDKSTGEWIGSPLIDFSQAFNLEFGMKLNYSASKLEFNLNVVPFFYLILYKILEIKSIINQTISFHQLESNEKLKATFPLEGTILKAMKIANEKDWFLIELNQPLTFDDKTSKQLLIKNQKLGVIKLNTNYQPVYCRVVLNENDLELNLDVLDNFPVIGLLTCE
jgi:hypothetical protein